MYAQEIPPNYPTKSLPDSCDRTDAKFESAPTSRTFYIIGKTESKRHNTPLSTITTTTASITPVANKTVEHESSICNRRKRDAITAQIFIRNPDNNVKSTIINISASNEKSKRPRWIILKAYESFPRTVSEEISSEKFDKTLMRTESSTFMREKIKKIDEVKCEATTATVIRPEIKQETFEQNKTNSDLPLRSQTDHITEAQIDDPLINSRIIIERKLFYRWKSVII